MERSQKLGAIINELVSFSLPLIFSGILQQLYSWADAFIIGNIEGEIALSAVGVTTTPINFFITTITGFTLGLSVLIAKNFGANKKENIPPLLAVFTVILGGIFLTVAILGSLFSYPFLALLHTPLETIDSATNYIRIIFLGLPFLALYNVYSATLRAIGNSKIPFLCILFSSCINVLLDILFVLFFRWGVEGAAVATILSQIAMAIFIVIYGTKRYNWLKSGYKKDSFSTFVIKEGVKFGLPPMLQSSISSLGGLVLQDFMNRFGTNTVTAITTAYRIDTLIMLPIVNLGSGISTLTGQSEGSKDTTKSRKTLIAGTILALSVSFILTRIVIPTGGKLISLLGAGEAAVMIGSAFFQRIALFYPIFGLTTAFRGYLEGKGDLVYSSAASMVSLLVRIAASYIMAPYFGNMTIAYAEMLSWVWLLVMYLMRLIKSKMRNRG